MIRGEDVGQRLLLRLPRMRGDDPDVMKALVALKEFAPHARG